jgi:hypothetical protein
VSRRFTPALFRSPVTAKAAIKGEVTFAIAGLKLGASAITFNLRPEHGGQALWLGGVFESGCDVLDLLGYILVAVFQRRLVLNHRFASGR